MDGNGDTEADNVVRLPRDWVGPPEELVPLGSRAREGRTADRSADGDPSEVLPNAGDFWGETAAAVHHVMRAPVEPRTAARARWRGERPRPPRVRRRTAVVAAITGVIAVLAILGVSEGHGPRPAPSAAARSQAHVRESTTTSHDAASRQGHRGHTRAAHTVPVRAFSERPSTRRITSRRPRTHGDASASRPARTPHPQSVITTAVATPVTSAPTSAGTSSATSTQVPTTATTARDGTATSAASTERAPSPSAGPLGPGDASGCDPKCS